MGRWNHCLGVVLCLVFALGSAALRAQGRDLDVSVFDVVDDGVPDAELLAGRYDAQFLALNDARVRVRGGARNTHWLRIAFELPPYDPAAPETWLLQFDRTDVERLAVYLPSASGKRVESVDGFYRPRSHGALAINSFAFELPPGLQGPQVIYAAASGLTLINLTPRVIDERSFHVGDRTVSSLISAVYAAILVITLSALALFAALRERSYLHFVGFTSTLLLLLLGLNGHLYLVPFVDRFAWWRGNGIYALALVCGVLALGFTRSYLETPRSDPRLLRWVPRLQIAMLAVALVCLFNVSALSAGLQSLAGALVMATGVAIVAIALHAWRRGEGRGLPYGAIWALLFAAVGSRIATTFGWLPQNPVTLYGFQVAAAVCLFLMSIGLADRVMEFRKQRDRARQLKEQTDASLQVEQVRRQFADDLRLQLRTTPTGGDLEWLAFKRLLSSLRLLMPQQSSAVIAFGYHGLDLLMAEPIDAKERYTRLLSARGGTLKGMCRSRSPLQAHLEEATEADDDETPIGGLFAVVPMPMPMPGWGVLLIERGPTESFDAAELKLAMDFLKQAVAATDEAATQAELKRKAELDPLTGACNRRSGDVLLETALKRAVADRRPLSVLYIDIDHFKQVNDRYGHAVGDDCLRLCADAIRREIGNGGVLIRHGGEEFLVVLPEFGPDQARQAGERVRQAVAHLRLDNAKGPVRFTVSVGIAGRHPGEEHPQQMVERADRALYSAKRNGRNQVQAAQMYGYGVQSTEDEPPGPLTL